MSEKKTLSEIIINPNHLRYLILTTRGEYTKLAPYVEDTYSMQLLDAHFGADNWSSETLRLDGLACTVRITANEKHREGSAEVNPKDLFPIKTAETSAFKRACARWGIGKYLYLMPSFGITGYDKFDEVTKRQAAFIVLVFSLSKYKVDDDLVNEVRKVYAGSIYLKKARLNIKSYYMEHGEGSVHPSILKMISYFENVANRLEATK